MTREERDKTIRILQWLHDNKFLFRSTEEDVKYATKLAIQVLLQEPCEDAISREAVLLFIEKVKESGIANYGSLLDIATEVRNLPSVNSQEPKILDTIDFAIDASNGDTNYFVGFRNGLRYAKSLVDGEEPQYESCADQKPTGHWIDREEYDADRWMCSECGRTEQYQENFCSNCGARMVEEQESEKINCKTTKCENCKNHNYCDYEPQERSEE